MQQLVQQARNSWCNKRTTAGATSVQQCSVTGLGLDCCSARGSSVAGPWPVSRASRWAVRVLFATALVRVSRPSLSSESLVRVSRPSLSSESRPSLLSAYLRVDPSLSESLATRHGVPRGCCGSIAELQAIRGTASLAAARHGTRAVGRGHGAHGAVVTARTEPWSRRARTASVIRLPLG